jgi:fatty-acyl-CoA synthase
VDRVKDVINTGGIQVSGSEVEEVLFDHEAVSDVAVIGLPDEKWIEAVSAVVVPKKDAETKNLRKDCKNTLEKNWQTSNVPNTSSS